MRENVFKDRSLQTYLQEIAKTETLSREEEYELAVKAQKGDEQAIKKLIESNLKFVVTIASNFQNRGLTLAELISEGNLGLITAIEKFDPGREVKLISYAVWWIRQKILFALAEKANLIRIPVGQANNYTKIRNIRERIRTETGEEATVQDLAEKSDISVSNITRMSLNPMDVLSIDRMGDDDKEDLSLINMISDSATLDPKTIYYQDKNSRYIQDSINRLDERSALIIRSYFGLDGNKSKNFAEIAEDLGLSRERVRQIHKQALAKILSETKDDLNNDIDYILANSEV